MSEPEQRTNITWSAYEEYLQDFSNYYKVAQRCFLDSYQNNVLIPSLWHLNHQLYIMEKPYYEKRLVPCKICGKPKDGTDAQTQYERMKAWHDRIDKLVLNYRSNLGNERFRRNNSYHLLNVIDEFFTELTELAVEKNFFPKAFKPRSVLDLTSDLRLR